MPNRPERFIKKIYRKWKSAQPIEKGLHPDEEALAGFIEGKLSYEENEAVKGHLVKCPDCTEKVAMQAKIEAGAEITAPSELIARVKSLVKQDKKSFLEVIFRLKAEAWELINTTGDVLVGQELVPAPALRSRRIKDFKDEVNIYKDFNDARVELKLENKQGKAFNLIVSVKEKGTQKIITDLRVTLCKEGLELESYHTDSGRITFENVILGKYTLAISTLQGKLAAIIIDIRQ